MENINGIETTGGGQDRHDGDLAIFDVQKVEMQFSVAADFVAAQVANNTLILALQTGRIMRIDLETPWETDDIDLPKKTTEIGTIRRMFSDPTASHLIISTSLGENYYLHTQSRTPKQLHRLRGVMIDCVSWNPSQPTASTREILIGAADGNIYETFLELSTEMFRKDEKYVKNIYQTEAPVCSIWTDQIPGRSDLRRILIGTSTRLLHFVGKTGRHGSEGSGSVFSRLFENEAPAVYEIDAGQSPPPSHFAVTPEPPDTPSMESSRPERIFAWLSARGLMHGKLLVYPPTGDLGKSVFKDARRLSSAPNERTPPKFVALTQWHVLELAGNKVIASNRLDDSVIFDQVVLGPDERPLALLADPKKNTFWLFSSKSIFEIVVRDEDRDVWKVMMKAEKFEEALQYANNATQRDAVATASGDYLIKKEKYSEAASVYGKSTKPFEEVALAFIDKDQRDALRQYLLTRLSTLKKSSKMQRVMLTSWLVEIFMTKLNSLDDMIMTKAELTEDKTTAQAETQLDSIRKEFQDFVRKYKDEIDRKTVYDIMNSHGREQELLYFSTTINDYNWVLSYWIQRENWPEALKALNRQTDSEIIYKYSTVLMAHAAPQFVDVLMRFSELDARKLIPACLNYNSLFEGPLKQNQAVRYLLYEINQHHSTDAAIHNLLLSIYASHPSPDESPLLSYLEEQSPSSLSHQKPASLPYDADFALRLCIQNSRVQSCIHIYSTMGQYTAAVDLALQHNDTELAIAVAERSEHDAATRKKLWLAVARSVIAGKPSEESRAPRLESVKESSELKGMAVKSKTKPDASQQAASIKTAISLLRRAPPGVLRIEDLLPLLPDFVLIDAFKEEICSALESYSSQIDGLRREMDDSAATASRIKTDVGQLDKRWVLLEPGESCAVCGEVLLDRRFWVWSCGHGVHSDCVAREVVRKGTRGVSRRVREIRNNLEAGVDGNRRDGLVHELDDLVGRECPLCGDMAVKMIDEPFVTSADDKAAWAL